jgi:hypothetical protein
MPRSSKPSQVGQGAILLGRQSHPVSFELRYSDSQGQRVAKGGLTGDAETMREAFRAGRARLALDDGKSLEIAIIAHTEGSGTAYFESAAALR